MSDDKTEFKKMLTDTGYADIDNRRVDNTPAVSSSFEVLSVMANQDLSLAETAEHFGISIDAVVEHLNAVKKKLGVETLERAVYLAIKQGHMSTPGYTF